MTDTDLESPVIPDAPAVPGKATKPRRPRNMPTYGVTPVGGDLPPQEHIAGRSKLYYELLTEVAKTPGEWCEIAHFQTPTGARSALKALEATGADAREIPDGEWEFETRKVRNTANPVGPKHSKLFARLVG